MSDLGLEKKQDKVLKKRASTVATVRLVLFAALVLMIVLYPDNIAGNVIYFFNLDEIFVAIVAFLFSSAPFAETMYKHHYVETYLVLCGLDALLCVVGGIFRVRRLVKVAKAMSGSQLRLWTFSEIGGLVILVAFLVTNVYAALQTLDARTHIKRLQEKLTVTATSQNLNEDLPPQTKQNKK